MKLRESQKRTVQRGILLAGGLLIAAGVGALPAAAPPAGTVIGNQASATYTDADGVERQATSNLAETYVQQVAALTLEADRTALVAPGGQAVFPHTLSNTGNGLDSFSLAVANQGGDDFDLTGLVMYADADQNGQPDNFTPITSTGPLAAGAQFHFVVVGTVAGAATGGQQAQVLVSVTSAFDGTKTASNTDTARVGTEAVLGLVKSMSETSGFPGSTNTVTLTYVNTGNNTATNVVIRDSLPVGMTYLAGSGRWTVSGATPLTDAAGGDPVGIDYSYSAPQVSATMTTVGPGATASVSFQVVIDAHTPAGLLDNTATVAYDDSTGTPVGPQN